MSGLTEAEKAIVIRLAHAWNAFLELPVEHGDDINEFRLLIHAAQGMVLARSGRREMNRLP